MEIVYKNKKKVAFRIVAIGEVFSWNGALYMRAKEAIFASTGELFNAISMRDGEGTYFDANDEVVPVKAQLVIS